MPKAKILIVEDSEAQAKIAIETLQAAAMNWNGSIMASPR